MNTTAIRIAFVIDALRVGGAERMLFDLVSRLPPEEFSCRVYTIVEQGELGAEFKRAGFPVVHIGKSGKISWATVKRLQAAWNIWRPDLVHTHLFAGDTYGRLAAWRSGIPVISTEHNMNLDETGLKHWVRTVLSWVTEQIVAVSQSVKNYSVQVEHISPHKIRMIYNGVDPVRFSSARQPSKHPIPVVGMTSRLHPNKGHEFFLRALALLPPGSFQGVIVGDGPERKRLEELAKTLRIHHQVQFTGMVQDIPQALQQMDLVILPSIQEGFGLSVVEAMLMEKAVIGFDIGPLKEVIQHTKTGWLVPAKNVTALSQAIHLFLTDPALRQRIGTAARQTALHRFSLQRMVEEYMSVYKHYTRVSV